jgi:hypothetical protein
MEQALSQSRDDGEIEACQLFELEDFGGQNNFTAKAVCLFMNMDQMVGGQFEKGLASMKSVAEAAAK